MTPPLPRGYSRARRQTKALWEALPHDQLTALDYAFFVPLLLDRSEDLARADNPNLRERIRVELERTARELNLRTLRPTPAPRRRHLSSTHHDPSDPYAALA